MIRPRAVAVLAAGTLALLTAGAAPAAAERWNHYDARRDVVHTSLEGPDEFVAAPRNRNTDVTRAVVRHSPNRVIVRTYLRDLNRRSGLALYQIDAAGSDYLVWHQLGNETFLLFGRTLERTLDRTLGPTLGRALGGALSRTTSRTGDPDDIRFVILGPGLDGPEDCPDAWQFAKRGRDVARISIPRSCLGNPPRVRAGVGVVGFDPVRERQYVDDGLRNGLDFSDLTMSRWVRRGPVR